MTLELNEIVEGNVEYLDDIKFDNEVYLYIVRSPYPRAIIRSIVPPKNYLAFYTSKELNTYMPARDVDRAKFVAKHPVLAFDIVNYVGQPVAAVIVDNKYAGEDALDEVYVEYEPLKAVGSIEDALKGDVVIHHGATDNISLDVDVSGGNLDAFQEAEVVVHRKLHQSRLVANPLEPKGCIAYFDGGHLHLYVSAQSPFRIRADVSEALGIPTEIIKVYSPKNVGGGFGNKVPAYPEYVIAAYASIKLKRPVKWIETRKEHLTNPTQGRGILSEVDIYAKRDGTIIGLRGRIVVDIGAYNFTINTRMAPFIASLLTGPYKMRAIDVKAVAVYTNLPPTGPYRGGGRPEAALIHETAVDALSEELGIDPLEIRLKNVADNGFKTPTGWDLGNYGGREVLQKAAAIYKKVREEYPHAGVAIALFAEHIRVSPGESCRIEVRNCRVVVGLGGIGPHGQAHRTAFKIVAARALDLSPEDVDVVLATTEASRWGVGSFGSRSLAVGAAAIIKAAEALKREVMRRGLSWPKDICALEGLVVEEEFRGGDIFGSGAHIAVVEISSGKPRIIYYYAVDNVGNVVLEGQIKAQIEGGVAQGVSQVFFEEAKYDREGNPLFFSIIGSGFPTAQDLSLPIVSEIITIPSSLPGGYIGVGEAGTTGGLSAVFLALEKALKKKGIITKLERTPVPEEVYAKLIDLN
ncbi:MAG: xanthine dehydrogenase family protein molybdopterin-binding subunit [Thermofilaceae archaeon]